MLPGRRERWQRDPRVGVLVVVAGAAFVAFVALGLALLLAPAWIRFDMSVSAAIRSIDIPGVATFARFATTVGDFWPMTVLTAAAAALFWARGNRTSAATLVLGVLSGSGFGAVLKLLFARVRPALEVARIPIPETYSFPSGHALTSVLFFGSLAFLIVLHEKSLRRAAVSAALCLFAALAIAMSRVYLGVHYLGDVVGSWLLGVSWLAVVVVVSARWGASSAEADFSGPGEDGS
jgi:undecaprenyl-diphosphatase